MARNEDGQLPDPVLPPCLPVAARPVALHPQRACHRLPSAFWLGGFGALANQNGRQQVPRCRPSILVRKIGNGPPRAGRPANLQRAVHERRHHPVRRAPNQGATLLRRPALRLLFPPFLTGLLTAHLIVLCMQSIFGMGSTTRGRCYRPRLQCDFALSEIPGPEAAALRASLSVGQQYFEHACTFYSRCNMYNNFRHERDASRHDNHCDLDDWC